MEEARLTFFSNDFKFLVSAKADKKVSPMV